MRGVAELLPTLVCLLCVQDMVVVVESSLSKSFDLSIYPSYPSAATGGSKFGSAKVLRPGKSAVLYLAPPEPKSFPSWAKPGEWGSGTLQIQKQEGNATEKGALIAIKIYAPAAAAASEKAEKASAATTPTAAAAAAKKPPPIGKPAEPEQDPAFPRLEQNPAGTSPPPASAAPSVAGATPSASPIASASTSNSALPVTPPASAASPSSLSIELRDLTIEHLSKLKKEGDVDKKIEALRSILPPLLAQFPSHLPLLFLELRLAHEVNASRPRGSLDREDAAVASKASALLTKHIDQPAVLAHFGRLVDKDDAAGQSKRKEMESVRSTVVRTLALQLDMATEELKAFTGRLRSAEFQPSAIKEIDATAAASASPSDDASAFAQSLAAVHALLSEIGSWVDLSSKDYKKLFAPVQTLLAKLSRQYGTLWKQISADLAAATTAGEGAMQQSLTALKIDLLSYLAAREPLYAHLAQFERDWSVVKFPKEFGLP